MKKIIVIYKTKHGSTRQYAEWISQELRCTAIPLEEARREQLKDYEIIIYGGAIHSGGILGFDKFKKWLKPILKGQGSSPQPKKIVIFSVGINNQERECRTQLRDINFDKNYLKTLTCYYFSGAYDPAKNKGVDKIIMSIVKKMAEGKPESQMTEADRVLLQRIKEGCNLVSKEQIEPLIRDICDS